MEVNEKYKSIYQNELQKCWPEFIVRDDENYKPPVPFGYCDEQLEFDALCAVIKTAFTKDKDYVCWSVHGCIKRNKNILETIDGGILKEYDPVLILDNLGGPNAFMMFNGETSIENGYVCPTFLYIDIDYNVKKYQPKVYINVDNFK